MWVHKIVFCKDTIEFFLEIHETQMFSLPMLPYKYYFCTLENIQNAHM